ncbi:MAG: hypothetical protein U0838_18195, partial [Chloroflexota bacterium]
ATITANDTLLAAGVTVPQGFDELALPLPPDLASPLQVMIDVAPFVPALAGESDDTRELGVMLDTLRCD